MDLSHFFQASDEAGGAYWRHAVPVGSGERTNVSQRTGRASHAGEIGTGFPRLLVLFHRHEPPRVTTAQRCTAAHVLPCEHDQQN
jgi:hypothetical protein